MRRRPSPLPAIREVGQSTCLTDPMTASFAQHPAITATRAAAIARAHARTGKASTKGRTKPPAVRPSSLACLAQESHEQRTHVIGRLAGGKMADALEDLAPVARHKMLLFAVRRCGQHATVL